MSYMVTAPLVIIANGDGAAGDWYGYAGAVVPQGHNDLRCEQLVAEGMLAEVESVQDPSEADEAKPTPIKDILAEVGDDQSKAAAALDVENARGDDARSSLVKKLEAIVNPGS